MFFNFISLTMGMGCGHWEVRCGVEGWYRKKKKGLLAPLQFWTLNVKAMIVSRNETLTKTDSQVLFI